MAERWCWSLWLRPQGRLHLARDGDASLLEAELAYRIQNAFARGAGHGLLHLGANEIGVVLPPALSFWREFAALYVTRRLQTTRRRRSA